MIAQLFASPVARRLAVAGAAVLAAGLFLVSLRRQGIDAGRLSERLEHERRVADARDRMLQADGPRDRSELARRMRDGTF